MPSKRERQDEILIDIPLGATENRGQPQKKPKALRFVTNYGAPHPKRRRIGAACLTCRKRKTACSGERPACDTCNQNNTECAGYSSGCPTVGHHRRSSMSNTNSTLRSSTSDIDQGPRRDSFEKRQADQENDIDPNLECRNNQLFNERRYRSSQNRTVSNERADLPTLEKDIGSHAGNGAESRERRASLFSGPRNRMPYFRWLGPTAIMPGFKQMVVKVKREETAVSRSSKDDGASGTNGMMSPPPNGVSPAATADRRVPSIYSSRPATVESDIRTPLTLPFYDTSPMPPSELVTHLANTFFTHLGCNYPFLQRERFLRDLDEKQVDAILVDAVCALAARFSTHPLLTQSADNNSKATPAEYGHAFAQRAKAALTDTFACPSVAAVQAALLLAYVEFGESRDSGLWMYLGISIRLAQDLGLHTTEGLKYKGRSGPTPKMIKRESTSGSLDLPTNYSPDDVKTQNNERQQGETDQNSKGGFLGGGNDVIVEEGSHTGEQKEADEQKAVEQERVDTFWAVFYLDRMVSSGTGRRSTLRDKDIDISFPASGDTDAKTGWPAPFPALIRIVHLYGRVADLLNSIKEPSDITNETPKRLANMESQVTSFYQALSPHLHFNAVNFQHYVKAGEGTNFVLLHFWFHTLIVLLHRPTLFKTFEGPMLQLFPNSQQLSMSSAKTIADILSYSQLMDAKASLGNPFTSQPIYIAACAFLKETAEQTATSNAQSRSNSPNRTEEASTGQMRSMSTVGRRVMPKPLSIGELAPQTDGPDVSVESAFNDSIHYEATNFDEGNGLGDRPSSKSSRVSTAKNTRSLAKHTLLATAASQHYQLCYKALQSLETYWAGTKYILTVLDQKFEGVGDPLLYTSEEGNCAMERPRPEPVFKTPGWRRKSSWGPYLCSRNLQAAGVWDNKVGDSTGSPAGEVGKAIGWTLTGTMNSPSTNLAWHYPSGAEHDSDGAPRQEFGASSLEATASVADHGSSSIEDARSSQHTRSEDSGTQRPLALTTHSFEGSATIRHDVANLPLGVDSPYRMNSHSVHPLGTTAIPRGEVFGLYSPVSNDSSSTFVFGTDANTSSFSNGALATWNYPDHLNTNNGSLQPFGNMMIESHDVDMSMLGLDMMPWFGSYPIHEMSSLFDSGGCGPANAGSDSRAAG